MVKEIKKYLIVASILILAYIAFLIIKPFITALLASFVLAYLFYPVHKRIVKLTNKPVLAATLTTLIIIIIIIFPIISIARTLISESIILFNSGVIEKTIEESFKYIESFGYFSSTINNIIEKLVIFIQEQSAKFLISIPSKVFHLLITVYSTFGLLLLGENFVKKIKNILPTKKQDELVKHLGDVTYSIVYGLFLTAIIEFILAIIAFKIIGSNIAFLLALIIGFLAFIPFLGPSIVWIPYVLIEIIRNNTANAIIIIILGIILFLIETFLKAKIIGHHSKVHPIIILIGTIGGIKLMGFIGLIIGPVILSGLITIIKDYYPLIKNET